MKTKLLLISLFYLLVLLSCNKFSIETQRLNNILSSYKTSITDKPHLYILQSKFSCAGCIESIFNQIDEVIKYPTHNITIISHSKSMIPKTLLNKIDFIEDTSSKIDYELKTIVNLSIFETKENHVTRFININNEDINELIILLKEFQNNK